MNFFNTLIFRKIIDQKHKLFYNRLQKYSDIQ